MHKQTHFKKTWSIGVMRQLGCLLLLLYMLFHQLEVPAASAKSNEEIYKFEKRVSDTKTRENNSFQKTNNWAVIVQSSKFFFNYRHTLGTLSIYRTIKRLGISDDKIILMLAEDIACNPRNNIPGVIINSKYSMENVYGEQIEVDFRGEEVTADNFLRLLAGRQPSLTPRSKRLMTDENSNILIYMEGHSGFEFFKFQNVEELDSHDIGRVFKEMHRHGRYNRIMMIADTCEAESLFLHFASPRLLGIGSAAIGEDSLSSHSDRYLGVGVVDRFTFNTLMLLENMEPSSTMTVADYLGNLNKEFISSTPVANSHYFDKPLSKTLMTEFFASSAPSNVQYVAKGFCMEPVE